MIKVVLETILENLKRLDFFGFIFSQKILFLNFLLRRGLQTTQNVLHFLIWWVETETNTLTSINLWNKIWGNFEHELRDLKMYACSVTSIYGVTMENSGNSCTGQFSASKNSLISDKQLQKGWHLDKSHFSNFNVPQRKKKIKVYTEIHRGFSPSHVQRWRSWNPRNFGNRQ